MAQSGGSFFAIQVLQRAPELYYVYIGVGQMVHQVELIKIAYVYMLEQYKARGAAKW